MTIGTIPPRTPGMLRVVAEPPAEAADFHRRALAASGDARRILSAVATLLDALHTLEHGADWIAPEEFEAPRTAPDLVADAVSCVAAIAGGQLGVVIRIAAVADAAGRPDGAPLAGWFAGELRRGEAARVALLALGPGLCWCDGGGSDPSPGHAATCEAARRAIGESTP